MMQKVTKTGCQMETEGCQIRSEVKREARGRDIGGRGLGKEGDQREMGEVGSECEVILKMSCKVTRQALSSLTPQQGAAKNRWPGLKRSQSHRHLHEPILSLALLQGVPDVRSQLGEEQVFGRLGGGPRPLGLPVFLAQSLCLGIVCRIEMRKKLKPGDNLCQLCRAGN